MAGLFLSSYKLHEFLPVHTSPGQKEKFMLAVREHHHHKTKILELSGRLDAHSKLGLETRILGATAMECHHVILNFANVTWMDLGGLGQLFVWYHNIHPQQIRLSIVNPQPMVQHVLDAAHLSDFIPIYHSEKEAMGAHSDRTKASG